MSTTAPLSRPAPAPRGRPLTRKHRLMLLLAFEIFVVGIAQSLISPPGPTGIVIEISVTPNHVVT